MARLLDNSSTEEDVLLAVLPSGIEPAPWSFGCWFYPLENTSNTTNIMSIGNSNTDNEFAAIRLRLDRLQGRIEDGAGATLGNTDNSVNFDKWNHCIWLEVASDDHTIVLNGDWANRTITGGTARSPDNMDTLALGLLVSNAPNPTDYFFGRLAEAAAWDVALRQEEVEQLAAGVSPLFIRPANLVFYCPIFGHKDPEPEYVSNAHMAVSGTPARVEHITGHSYMRPAEAQLIAPLTAPIEEIDVRTFIADTNFNPALLGDYHVSDGKVYIPVVDTLGEISSPVDEQLVFIAPSGRLGIFHGPSGWMLSAIGIGP